MTTTVSIHASPAEGKVCVVHYDEGESCLSRDILRSGEQKTLYVHDLRQVTVEEMDEDVAASLEYHGEDLGDEMASDKQEAEE